MNSFMKYFTFGALLALPLVVSADAVPPCWGTYPSCCPTCKNKLNQGGCVAACQAGCVGLDLNTCEGDCASNCP